MLFHCKNALICTRRTNTNQFWAGKRWLSHSPLRILFCGSDEFSIHSLKALDQLHRKEPERISNITVLCRPDKHVGRGLKEIRTRKSTYLLWMLVLTILEPIKTAAKELDLDIIEVDTFKGWKEKINSVDLIVTVSFGLLVPESIINLARYGGINVHPSLLPQFRGAAPIQHALMHRVKTTGVSIQTMHPTKFDHGIVLDQEEVALDHGSSLTTQRLLDQLTPIGADLLVRTLQRELFIDPRAVTVHSSSSEPLLTAPKITKLDRRIDWQKWTAEDILTRDRVLNNLWDEDTVSLAMDGSNVASEKLQNNRIIYHGPWSLVPPGSLQIIYSKGRLRLIKPRQEAGNIQLVIETSDGELVVPTSATIESQSKGKGWQTLLDHLHQRFRSNRP